MIGARAFAAPRSIRFLTPALLLMVCLLFLQARFRLVLVIGESMRPTLNHGNLLLVARNAYEHREPQRGDLVVAWCYSELIVKRVVGVPGEEVEIIEGTLFVNRQPVVEQYAVARGSLNIDRGRLAGGRFALLGDNRGLPEGQTVSAIVSKGDMLGKVICRIPVGR